MEKIKKKRKFKFSLPKKTNKALLGLLVISLFFISSFTFYNLIFIGKIYPNVFLAGVSVGGKDVSSLPKYLANNIKVPEKISLTSAGQKFNMSTEGIDFSYDFLASSQRAYNLDRTGNTLLDFVSRIKALTRKEKLGLIVRFNEEKLNAELSDINQEVSIPPVSPSIALKKGEVIVDKGKEGKEIDLTKLRSLIGQDLSYAKNESINIPFKVINQTLSDSEAETARARGEKLVGKSLALSFEFQTYTYKGNDLFNLLNPKAGYDDEAISTEIDRISSELNRSPKNPVFNFSEGKVNQFQPAQDGILVKKEELKEKIVESLKNLETTEPNATSFDIPVTKTSPEVQTGDVNNLGIKELLGRGVSHFRGSIPSRIHNISLASSKLNAILVKPGDTFSFNSVLGDVSVFTGYQQAYIIRDGKTILGDGGGVCQVSSTLFRAILNAGLPVVERRAHSYRVGYYEQDSPPGFDATVYSPSPDLKFKNDTPNYILIQTIVEPKKYLLVFEIYGTSDGRIATTTKPKITDQVEPPPDLYQDDPTLPLGKIKQIDYRAWGAKVTFTYKVVRGGETIFQKTFVSNYQPWQAIYLRGTGPAQ